MERDKKIRPSWQVLLKSVLETEEYEINCQECYDLLDQYADLILGGTDPAAIIPAVQQHLNHCLCCTGEFEALMVMIQEAAAKSKQSTSL